MPKLIEINPTAAFLHKHGYPSAFKAWIVYKNKPAKPVIMTSFDMVNSISQVRAGYQAPVIDFEKSFTSLVNTIERKADKILRASIYQRRGNKLIMDYDQKDGSLQLILNEADSVLNHPERLRLQGERAEELAAFLKKIFEKEKQQTH
jgi:hypothetical protein